LGDALDNRQAEADTCVVGVYAFGAALERRAPALSSSFEASKLVEPPLW
jgi:hypothetical protein